MGAYMPQDFAKMFKDGEAAEAAKAEAEVAAARALAEAAERVAAEADASAKAAKARAALREERLADAGPLVAGPRGGGGVDELDWVVEQLASKGKPDRAEAPSLRAWVLANEIRGDQKLKSDFLKDYIKRLMPVKLVVEDKFKDDGRVLEWIENCAAQLPPEGAEGA